MIKNPKQRFLTVFIALLVLINLLIFIKANAQLNGTFQTTRFVNVTDSNTVVGNEPALIVTQGGGIIYYNTQSNKFRVFDNGVWKDLLGSGSFSIQSEPDQIILDSLGTVRGTTVFTYDAFTSNNFVVDNATQNIISAGSENNIVLHGSLDDTSGPIDDTFSFGSNNSVFTLGGSIANSGIIGGSTNSIETSVGNPNHMFIIGSDGSSIDQLSNSLILGGTNINLTSANQSNAVYLPALFMGLGTGGSTGILADPIRFQAMYRNPLTGQVTTTTTSPNVNPSVKVERLITSAEILNLNTTPIELVPAFGADTIITVTSQIYLTYDFNVAAYATNTNVQIIYGTSGDVLGNFTALLAETADRFSSANVAAFPVTNPASDATANNIQIFVPTGDPTTGQGTLRVMFMYQVHRL